MGKIRKDNQFLKNNNFSDSIKRNGRLFNPFGRFHNYFIGHLLEFGIRTRRSLFRHRRHGYRHPRLSEVNIRDFIQEPRRQSVKTDE